MSGELVFSLCRTRPHSHCTVVAGVATSGLRKQVSSLPREDLEDRLLRLHDETLDLKRRTRDAEEELKKYAHPWRPYPF